MNAQENLVYKYFPDITEYQLSRFAALQHLYQNWNAKINVISRKDISHLTERHVLHSLSIAKIVDFKPGAKILDIGTGGGFPGIPLAILFPKTKFVLIDSIKKKIRVVNAIIEALELKNVNALAVRAEDVPGHYDFITCRAVAKLTVLHQWTKGKIKQNGHHSLANGLLCFKGGDIRDEIDEIKAPVKVFALNEIFDEPFFESKKLVHVH